MLPRPQIDYLTDEIRHDHFQVDIYKYINVCAVTKYLLDAQNTRGLHVSQEAQCTGCIVSYMVGYFHLRFIKLNAKLKMTS